MGDLRYRVCRGCGRSTEQVGELSWTRQCEECGTVNLYENVAGLVAHTGPAFLRWRQGMAASVGLTLLDDSPANQHTAA